MDFGEYFVRLLTVLAVLIGITNTVMVWAQRTNRELRAKVDRQETKLAEHDRRIQTVENDIRHLPTKDDLNEIATQVAKMDSEVSTMARVVNRIDEFLRSKP